MSTSGWTDGASTTLLGGDVLQNDFANNPKTAHAHNIETHRNLFTSGCRTWLVPPASGENHRSKRERQTKQVALIRLPWTVQSLTRNVHQVFAGRCQPQQPTMSSTTILVNPKKRDRGGVRWSSASALSVKGLRRSRRAPRSVMFLSDPCKLGVTT